MPILKFKIGVHLSEAFGGIKHGEDTRTILSGSIVEIKSSKLASHLVENGWAEVQDVENAPAAKTPKKAKSSDEAPASNN